MHPPLSIAIIDTPLGPFQASFSELGLARLEFPSPHPARSNRHPNPAPSSWTAQTRRALLDVLSGKTPRQSPPLDLRVGTAFQRRVWSVLRRIPPGQTRTYGQVARAIGRPGAPRAVGQACGANPIPLLIPCHRVVATGGQWGGFSGGLHWKKRLLKNEAESAGRAHR